MSVLPEELERRLREEVARRGLELLDLRRRGARGTSVLEVIVDAERPVTLDELTDLTRFTNALLDENEEAIAGRYRLEVSSAGLDRPLEHPWQYRKNVGRLLKLTLEEEPTDGAPPRTSTELYRLHAVEEQGLTVEPVRRTKRGLAGSGASLPVPFARIHRAVVEPEL